MSEKSVLEGVLKSPFPREAAEALWDTLKTYGNKQGLELRLERMTRAGIVSEVTDLVEALEMKPEDALPYLITAYNNQAESALSMTRFHRKEGRDDLVVEETRYAEKSRLHSNKLKNGEITVEEEIKARIKEREDITGTPDNNYVDLLRLRKSLIPEEK